MPKISLIYTQTHSPGFFGKRKSSLGLFESPDSHSMGNPMDPFIWPEVKGQETPLGYWAQE